MYLKYETVKQSLQWILSKAGSSIFFLSISKHK